MSSPIPFSGVRSYILGTNTTHAPPNSENRTATPAWLRPKKVLAELLVGLASRGTVLRRLATQTVDATLEDTAVVVHRQSHESFLAGLELYRHRADKGYSLVDCVSMNTMRRERIAEVLTNDRHFTQEGFRILLP